MEGWIRLHRKFLEHWLCDEYRPLTKREAWENMLFWANYKDTKVMIKGELIECKRGQILYSLDTWSNKFNWPIGQVRRFFKLLKADKMITIKGLKYTTKITICNYDIYNNNEQTADILPTFCRQTDDNKRKKDNKEKKDKNIIYWKNNFKIYLKECTECYSKLINDEIYINDKQKYYPNIDIKLTLEKSFIEFWGTEAGWEHKKNKRAKNINWTQTFNNALSLKSNQVYKSQKKLTGAEIFKQQNNG